MQWIQFLERQPAPCGTYTTGQKIERHFSSFVVFLSLFTLSILTEGIKATNERARNRAVNKNCIDTFWIFPFLKQPSFI